MNISESRASQIKKHAIKKIKTKFFNDKIKLGDFSFDRSEVIPNCSDECWEYLSSKDPDLIPGVLEAENAVTIVKSAMRKYGKNPDIEFNKNIMNACMKTIRSVLENYDPFSMKSKDYFSSRVEETILRNFHVKSRYSV